MNKLFQKKSAKLGFTLIELLVVIAIIGVLASIVLASLNNARMKSRDARRITDVKQLQLALELYFDGQGNKYPVATTGVGTCVASGNAYGLEVLATTNYIPQVPRDPLSSATTPACYRYSTKLNDTAPTTYHLGAAIEDKNVPALGNDKDSDTTSTDVNGFNGLSITASHLCGVDAGTAGPGGTELCYDVTP